MSLYLIPIFFAITIFHISIFIYSLKTTDSRLTIVVHYLFFITNTILTTPNLLINLSILACTQTSPFTKSFTCFQDFHVVYVIFACLNIIWLLFCTIFVFTFYVSRNPFSKDYFSTSSNIWILAKLLIKIAPAVYLNIDPDLQFNVLYVVSFAGINLLYFGIFKIMWRYFRSC
jgi:hypothetical protein